MRAIPRTPPPNSTLEERRGFADALVKIARITLSHIELNALHIQLIDIYPDFEPSQRIEKLADLLNWTSAQEVTELQSPCLSSSISYFMEWFMLLKDVLHNGEVIAKRLVYSYSEVSGELRKLQDTQGCLQLDLRDSRHMVQKLSEELNKAEKNFSKMLH